MEREKRKSTGSLVSCQQPELGPLNCGFGGRNITQSENKMTNLNLYRTININLERSDNWIEFSLESDDKYSIEVNTFFGGYGDDDQAKKLMVSNALIDLRQQIDQMLQEEEA